MCSFYRRATHNTPLQTLVSLRGSIRSMFVPWLMAICGTPVAFLRILLTGKPRSTMLVKRQRESQDRLFLLVVGMWATQAQENYMLVASRMMENYGIPVSSPRTLSSGCHLKI